MAAAHHAISVIIPAYNMARTLGRTIESVLAQTMPAHEIIVVDDGSRDQTGDVARSFGPRVTCIRQENGGVSAAQNTGLRAATGEWIAFLDADDWWEPHRLEAGARALAADPTLRWAAGRYVEWWPDGVRRLAPQDPALDSAPAQSLVIEDYFAAALRDQSTFHTLALTIHRGVFEQVGGFDERLRSGQDLDMWYRIATRYPRIGYSTRPLGVYDRRFEGSLTRHGRSQSPNFWVLLTNHIPERACPQPPGVSARDDLFRQQVRLAAQHALRMGETAQVRRLLERFRSWFPARDRALFGSAARLPGGLLRWAANRWQRRTPRLRWLPAGDP